MFYDQRQSGLSEIGPQTVLAESKKAPKVKKAFAMGENWVDSQTTLGKKTKLAKGGIAHEMGVEDLLDSPTTLRVDLDQLDQAWARTEKIQGYKSFPSVNTQCFGVQKA